MCQELAAKQKAELKKLKLQDLSQYVIKGAETDWQQALGNGKLGKSSVSVKRYRIPGWYTRAGKVLWNLFYIIVEVVLKLCGIK